MELSVVKKESKQAEREVALGYTIKHKAECEYFGLISEFIEETGRFPNLIFGIQG